MGDALMVILPATALGTTVALRDWGGTGQLGLSMLVTGGTTTVLKWATDRERPDGSDDDSFPSGHTSITFAASSFIHFRYGFKYAIPAYAAAAFTGYSRIDSERHHLGDVLAGAAIGVVSGWLLVEPFEPADVNVSSDGSGRIELVVTMGVGF